MQRFGKGSTSIDILERQVAEILRPVAGAKVYQAMGISMETLHASPVRVYVECDQKPFRATKPTGDNPDRKTQMKIWREKSQRAAAPVIDACESLLKSAGINYKRGTDCGWPMIVILPV